MSEWNLSIEILFIGLFAIIIGIYFIFLGQTTIFLLKKRPISSVHRWKKRFPLLRHIRITQGKRGWQNLFTLLFVILLSYAWVIFVGEPLYGFFFVMVCFAFVVITKEYAIHYYLTEDQLLIWSVHTKGYNTPDGEHIHYRYIVNKKDIKQVEKVSSGFHIYVDKDKFVYVYTDKKAEELLTDWFPKKHLHR